MSLKDATTTLAALDVLHRAVKERLDIARGEVMDELLALRDAAGVKSAQVTLPSGAAIGSVTLTDKKPRGAYIADEAAFIAWARSNASSLVVEVPEQVIPAHYAVMGDVDSDLLPYLIAGPLGLAVDPTTGEAIDGVLVDEHAPVPSSFSLRFAAGGRQALIDAWKRGELDALAPLSAPALAAGE